jgi:ATP-dependent DNA helicase RecG
MSNPKGHISVLRNPDIAHALYLRGLMEKAGRGSVLMVQQCREAGLPAPFWRPDLKLGVTVTFPAPETTPQDTPQDTQQDTQQVLSLLTRLDGERSRDELVGLLGPKDRKNFSLVHLNPALEAEVVERTIPEKPSSRLQKYRPTQKGQQANGKHL